MVVLRASIQKHTRYQLFKAYHIKIAGKLGSPKGAGFIAPDQVKQRIFGQHETVRTGQFGKAFKMFHNVKITLREFAAGNWFVILEG